MKEKKMRIEDALNATRAAVEEGIVPGGGSALVYTTEAVSQVVNSLDGDQKVGAEIIKSVLTQPLKQIALNAGVDGEEVVAKVIASSDKNFGYDALHDTYLDMVENGIIDPTKVTRSALQNAASVASTLLTTEAVVVDIPEPTVATPQNPEMY